MGRSPEGPQLTFHAWQSAKGAGQLYARAVWSHHHHAWLQGMGGRGQGLGALTRGMLAAAIHEQVRQGGARFKGGRPIGPASSTRNWRSSKAVRGTLHSRCRRRRPAGLQAAPPAPSSAVLPTGPAVWQNGAGSQAAGLHSAGAAALLSWPACLHGMQSGGPRLLTREAACLAPARVSAVAARRPAGLACTPVDTQRQTRGETEQGGKRGAVARVYARAWCSRSASSARDLATPRRAHLRQQPPQQPARIERSAAAGAALVVLQGGGSSKRAR